MELHKKLQNFPRIYCISLAKDFTRRNILIDGLAVYGISPDKVHFNISKTWKEAGHWWCGDLPDNFYVNGLCDAGKSIVINHLTNIHTWLTNTDENEEYAFFCEDDISFETAQYWNFTWPDFVDRLPKDWQVLQLQTLRVLERYPLTNQDMTIRKREWYNWGATGWLMKRSYAQKLIEKHITRGGVWCLVSLIKTPYDIPPDAVQRPHDLHKWPYPEHIVYGLEDNKYIYTMPLFVENIFKTGTTIDDRKPDEEAIKSELITGTGHYGSCNFVLNWWKENANKHTLDYILPNLNINVQQYIYKAYVNSIYDGDTITVDIDLGFNVWLKNQKIRLEGINAPEVRGEEKNKGIVVRDRLAELILNKNIIIETLQDKKEKYGRWLGKVYLDSILINEKLLQEGLVEKYIS